ncbi:alpha-glucan family phosphorylase [Olivibacter jilunii]|uniref:alpha-glucan family phosphorylase n=1 Tax=Olivibacter jilunii TaxID=985016 RepID=UPI00103138B6|nr:alpha-glucan family phosphorylase [Olivibacter jilunii]
MTKIKLPPIDVPLALSASRRPAIKQLAKLALDLKWSWNHHADEIWQSLNHELWNKTHNPWLMLQSFSIDPLKAKIKDREFLGHVQKVADEAINKSLSTSWFDTVYKKSSLDCVAYFSMEYMLTESLPIYVGGLGNVAGDQLKAANDLGVPVVAVGLLYQQGYFRQELGVDGRQLVFKPSNDSSQLPIVPVRKKNGEWLRIKLNFSKDELWIKVWQVQIGDLRLFLLDTNDAANPPVLRGITSEIYGGGMELRIQQEIVLGIGGYKVLRELDIYPQVCHLNEGHAAFLILERARVFMSEKGCSFEEALYSTRVGNLFTTHTAIAAGFDYYTTDLLNLYLGSYITDELCTDVQTIENLGKVHPNDPNENFGMAYLAIRGCGAINGVSQLHMQVSKHLFSPLFNRLPLDEVPIGFVTNGIHVPTWASRAADDFWKKNTSNSNHWHSSEEDISKISNVSDTTFWEFRNLQRADLVKYIRENAAKEMYLKDTFTQRSTLGESFFDPDVFTIGFARRFVPYKRNSLLLYDEQRLLNIIRNHKAPVQIVLAGKAPPFDGGGNDMIRHWVEFIRLNKLETKVIFLSDYDIALAQQMIKGVDVWLNTPRRPWEACGTSGMKILANGGLNISVLDGWWAEAFDPAYGWSIGDGKEYYDNGQSDYLEANQLYDLLEKEILPMFYVRDENGIPTEWIKKIRRSMSDLTLQFSATRTVKEYTEKYYVPLSQRYLSRTSKNKEDIQVDILQKKSLMEEWNEIAFDGVTIESSGERHTFRASVRLGEIDPCLISVELYADQKGNLHSEKLPMGLEDIDNESKYAIFYIEVNNNRPTTDYTARIIPNFEQLDTNILETHFIKWSN